MKKVLIISYFFPPCNLTAGQRILGWAKYLKEFDYQPVIITRNWDIPIENPKDLLISSGEEIIHENHNTHEVYYLPYTANRRDRYFVKNEGSKKQAYSKILTAFNLIAENFSVNAIPHHNLYDFAREYIIKNRDIDQIIISGNPFDTFYFGYLLNKEFNIDWIADYRDDWSTNELRAKPNFLLKTLHKRSEKKWVSTASCFTTVSKHYLEKIKDLTKLEGHLISNGYDFETLPSQQVDDKHFTITYNGSLYMSQDIETFLEVTIQLINEGFTELKLQFPGLAFDLQQKNRVSNLTNQIKDNVLILPRIEREEILQMQQNSDILLMLSYGKLKGIPSSKLYEYIGLQKPVLTFPSDHDIIEETLNQTGLGIICNDKHELYTALKDLLTKKRNHQLLLESYNQEVIENYSRKFQVKKLAQILASKSHN